MDLNIKPKTIQLMEENKGKSLWLGLVKDLLGMMQKTQTYI